MAPPQRLAMINSDAKLYPPLPDPVGIQTTLYQLHLRVFPRTRYDHLFTELGTVATAEEAVAAGCDGIYVDTFGDYGVELLRSVLDVPVVGAGEASLAVAASRWPRYSIVTVWPRSMAYLYQERLATCEGGDAGAGVHFLSDEDELQRTGTDRAVNARLKRGDDAVATALARLCAQAVATDHSDGVLLGCTCMSPVADELEERSGIPVLDPSRAGLEAAFAAIRARATDDDRPTGVRPASRIGLASALTGAYLERQGMDAEQHGSCEVCVTADA